MESTGRDLPVFGKTPQKNHAGSSLLVNQADCRFWAKQGTRAKRTV
jgi:hypothetical protein